ncbi:hypothetical protein [Prauserella rugosa]|uniref:Uncharacterized protein n=1 Tax=Prauserella rugosa TaxID=43354 RepID=A0A660CHT6_9PSEU|nr:hypothetical protein [Prauserella rugosa]KMS85419.1 hypothetical protein ACZ91_42445 [Streptomyces regensis]TWH21417.1 hypothetical protein JD82_03281 [Prauserella rugosa]
MLHSHEAAELRRRESRKPIRWLLVALGSLVAALIPVLIAVSTSGGVDHLLGRTEPVTATVERVDVSGKCKHRTEHRITAAWHLDGHPGRGEYRRCGDPPAEGSAVELWIGDDGHIEQESPTATRNGIGGLSLVMAALVWVLSVAILVPAGRRRRRLLATGSLPLAQAVPVELHVSRRVRMTVHDPAGRRHVVIEPVLHSGRGRRLTGSWWLYPVPNGNDRRRSGLLVRGHERCWIDMPGTIR